MVYNKDVVKGGKNMATLSDMKKYLGKGIEDCGGYVSSDYKSFERKYRNFLSNKAKEVNGELVKFNPNHYEFSCFIKRNDKIVYIGIADVRHFKNEWYNHILIRTAQNEKDYHGGRNNYATMDNIGSLIVALTD